MINLLYQVFNSIASVFKPTTITLTRPPQTPEHTYQCYTKTYLSYRVRYPGYTFKRRTTKFK